jgi:hypothetical protein
MDTPGMIWDKIDSWAGPSIGLIMIGVAIYLMFRGAKRIKLLSFLTGCGIGYLSSTILYENLGDMISASESDFTFTATIACGVVTFLAVGLVSIAVTVYISLHVMLWTISMIEMNGYDVNTGVMGILVAVISWLVNRYLRKHLFLFGSAAIASMMALYGYLILNGQSPSEISISDPTLQLVGLALFLNSVLIQRQGVKQLAKDKEEKEIQKEYDRESDVYGRGRFMEPDILAAGSSAERQQFR